ncbi:MAG TPA: hypothetical protein VF903_10185 [Nitrospirota bacterium]
MKWHKIEIDDEVMQQLKKLADPFKDTTPNSVLRRELLKERQSTNITSLPQKTNDKDITNLFPIGTPMALQQILEVISLVRQGAYDRGGATHFVARKHNCAPQTVQDKYGRQLSLTAEQFDRLLIPQRSHDLATLLIKKFPSHSEIIRKVVEA